MEGLRHRPAGRYRHFLHLSTQPGCAALRHRQTREWAKLRISRLQRPPQIEARQNDRRGAFGFRSADPADFAPKLIGNRGQRDRKSVVSGKSVSVRLQLGGRSIIKKKKKKN